MVTDEEDEVSEEAELELSVDITLESTDERELLDESTETIFNEVYIADPPDAAEPEENVEPHNLPTETVANDKEWDESTATIVYEDE